MTRHLTGSLHTSRPRSPYILPIGHLSNKSSVYSPVSMSHMSQDLVYNHMKSHYQRIASAKACVDTARPKSMKLTIKGKDRNRQETLQRSFETTLDRPSSRARQTHSQWKDNSRNVKEEDASFLEQNSVLVHRKTDHTETMSVDEVRGLHTDEVRGHSGESRSRIGDGSSAGERDNIGKEFRSKSSRKDGGGDIEGSRINNMKSDKNSRSSCKDLSEHPKRDQLEFDQNGYRNYQRTNNRTAEYNDLPLTDSSGLQNINDSLKQTGNLGGTQIDRLFTSIPRFTQREHEEEDFLNHSNPQISNVSFSYKEPPSPRRKNKKSSQEIIWTEEQKYLNFISDVTTDILARGIFSNRVLSRVFESHIEKRKDDLDEEHMREMINQLKQDLGITDC